MSISEMRDSDKLLVADVGGTNVRFGIATREDAGELSLKGGKQFLCAGFENFSAAMEHYLAQSEQRPRKLAISLAGPVRNGQAEMTNLNWRFDAARLQEEGGFESVHLLHDLAAQALAIPVLSADDQQLLRKGIAEPGGNKAIIGLGTGLGVAQLSYIDGKWHASSGEGGHASFAPRTAAEQLIFESLRERWGYVSLEMLLSGPGLVNIVRCLAAQGDAEAAEQNPKDVLAAAARDEDSLCARAVRIFVDVLANMTGDVALTLGATGGVYLAGGLTRHLAPFLLAPSFTEGFIASGFRARYLKDFPVHAVLHPHAGLLGAANYP